MTPGQEALREAARLEAARVYGGVVREPAKPVSLFALVAEAELAASLDRARRARETAAALQPDPIIAAVGEGLTNTEIMHRFGAEYGEIRAVRKRLMSEGAA